MLFNSYIFIFLFLPITLLGFYILREKQATLAKVWLTCFSFWFYGYFNFSYLTIMLVSIIGNYGIHRQILKKRREKREEASKIVLILGIVLNLFILFYFKYYDFFLENVNIVLHTSFPLKGILLPLGISFFTFQQLSFLVDTYRGELDGCSFLDYALFVSFFPQLIAGPIVTHEEMLPQFQQIGADKNSGGNAERREITKKLSDGKIRTKEEGSEYFVRGIYIFVLGLSKKVLLADTFGIAVDYAYANVSSLNGLESFLVILFYSIQLYFDFSGYCDMARGIAILFDMKIATNFESPYQARNIVEFWKRWHITLSRFFTKNIYIPFGGNRKGKIRTYLNYAIVFFLSGLWHGAGWNFILWGLMHGGLYIITKMYLDVCKKKMLSFEEKENLQRCDKRREGKVAEKAVLKLKESLSVLFTFSYISVAWVYFRATGISQANELLGNVFRKGWLMPGESFLEGFNLGELWYPMKILKITNLPYATGYTMIGFLLLSVLIIFCGKNITQLDKSFKPTVWNACITAVLFLWCVISLSGVSTFLYFNF